MFIANINVSHFRSGVYDLFYEPIDGLLGEKGGSFLAGLSRGGRRYGTGVICDIGICTYVWS